jgi:hypothetical protein
LGRWECFVPVFRQAQGTAHALETILEAADQLGKTDAGKDVRFILLFTSVIPSKLFECMGMGIPVLHGVAGESADIVEKEEGAGGYF